MSFLLFAILLFVPDILPPHIVDTPRRPLTPINKAGNNSCPVDSRPLMQHPGFQILHQQLEQLHTLRIGQGVHVDGGRHVQELLAFGRLGGLVPGNGKRLMESGAFRFGGGGWTGGQPHTD